jgi:hypothetical protein
VLKLKNPMTNSPSNVDLAPLPERRRSTFREPAAEVDLGLFGLPKGDPEVGEVNDAAVVPPVGEVPDAAEASEIPEAGHVPEASDVVEAIDVPEASDVPDASEFPEATETLETPEAVDVPDSTETPVATAPVAPEGPVVTPQQQRARHRADRAGNRRATGSSAFRVVLPAH